LDVKTLISRIRPAEFRHVISQTAEYALRAVVMLGTAAGQPLTVTKLADRTKVPSSYLSKVLQSLGRAGLVEARRGLNGGFTLVRPLDEVTVLDVIKAVDSIKRITRCPLGLSTHQRRLCPLHRRLDSAIALVETHFGDTTIAQLIDEETSSPPLCEADALTSSPSK
jgi:Rrf2 family protein